MKLRMLLGAVLLVAAVRLAAAGPEVVDGVAAIVNNRTITYSDVREYSTPAVEQLQRDYSGPQLTEKVRTARLDALQNLIDRILIVQEYEGKGYKLPENIIDTRIDEVIANDFGGDRTAFIKTLAAENVTLSEYRQKLWEGIIVQAMRTHKMQEELVASPSAVEKYYQDHLADYQVPEQIQLRMIYIKPTPTGGTNAVAGATAPVDPRRQLAEEILGKLNGGDSFESLARVYSDGKAAKEGGSLGWISRDILQKQLSDAAFALKSGQHTGVIETPEGYYILQVDDAKPARTKPLNEVRTDIEKIVLQQSRTAMQAGWIKQLRAKAYIRLY